MLSNNSSKISKIIFLDEKGLFVNDKIDQIHLLSQNMPKIVILFWQNGKV